MPEAFEIHLTVEPEDAARLASFAAERGVKHSVIELAGGAHPVQPMLTVYAQGSEPDAHDACARWMQDARAAGLRVVRARIEAGADSSLAPASAADALHESPLRYFEHHLKLLLHADPGPELAALVEPYGAHVSRNARRVHAEGWQERFVTQRCHYASRVDAGQRLDRLVDTLTRYSYTILEIEKEYVLVDSRPELDAGWLDPGGSAPDLEALRNEARRATRSRGLPTTSVTMDGDPRVSSQPTPYDPALRHYGRALRAGEPVIDGELGRRWRTARREAMVHVLSLIADASWGHQLVLRGSVTLWAWLGEVAREPGDLDFVVRPATVPASGSEAAEILGGLIQSVADGQATGLSASGVRVDDIWTYERAEGRRLAFPFAAPDLPVGTIQIDITFAEELPVPPESLVIPPMARPVNVAPPALQLAWKLRWLLSDDDPQGKDLYDAVLLAEHTTASPALIRAELAQVNPEEAQRFGPTSVLSWSERFRWWDIDWENFCLEYPHIEADPEVYLQRLAIALDRSFNA